MTKAEAKQVEDPVAEDNARTQDKDKEAIAEGGNATAKDDDFVAKENITTAQDKDFIAAGDNATTQREDFSAVEDNATAQDKDPMAEGDNTTVQDEDSAAEEDRATSQDEDAAAGEDSGTPQKKDAVAGEVSGKAQDKAFAQINFTNAETLTTRSIWNDAHPSATSSDPDVPRLMDVDVLLSEANTSYEAFESHGVAFQEHLNRRYQSAQGSARSALIRMRDRQTQSLKVQSAANEALHATNAKARETIESLKTRIQNVRTASENAHLINERFREILAVTRPKLELGMEYIEEALNSSQGVGAIAAKAMNVRQAHPSAEYLLSVARSELRPSLARTPLGQVSVLQTLVRRTEQSPHPEIGDIEEDIVQSMTAHLSNVDMIVSEARNTLEKAYTNRASLQRERRLQLLEERRVLNETQVQMEQDYASMVEGQRALEGIQQELSGRIDGFQLFLSKVGSAGATIVDAAAKELAGVSGADEILSKVQA